MAVAYTLPLAILMPSFAFYEVVRTSSECTDLEAGKYQNKYYSYQPEFKYVPGSHSAALWNEHFVLKLHVAYVSELLFTAEKMIMSTFKDKILPEVSKYKLGAQKYKKDQRDTATLQCEGHF